MNSVVLIGNLARDPELRYTQSQHAVCTFTIAVNRPRRNSNEPQKADFIRINTWNKTAENCNRYLTKGRKVGVKGRIQTGSYTDRDGKTVYTTDVVAEEVEFLGAPQQNSDRQNNPQAQQSYPQPQSGYTNVTPHIEPDPQGYQAPPQDQQMAVDDLPEGYAYIDEDDVPF